MPHFTSLARFGLMIEGPAYLPGPHRPGSPGARYRQAADRLLPMAALWHHAVENWPQPGTPGLHLRLAANPSTQAAHEPGLLLIGAAASPGATARAFGSAILHLLRPDLWQVTGIDPAAFRRGFADAAALLATLHQCPDAASRRQARAGAATAFAAVVADVVELFAAATRPARRPADPVARTARLLAAAIRQADLALDFTAQVAAEMILLAWRAEGPELGNALADLLDGAGLLARGDIPAQDAARARLGPRPNFGPATTWVGVDGSMVGIDAPLLVCTPAAPPRFSFTRPPGSPMPTDPLRDLQAFFQRLGSLELLEVPRPGTRPRPARTANPTVSAVLEKDGPALRLRRVRFITA